MNESMQFKVGLFIFGSLIFAAGFFAYLGYERGWFEQKLSYTLIAPNAENIIVGMPVSFRGITVGQVNSLSLTKQGMARIMISVDSQQSVWLRANSQFSLDKPLVGTARIKVESADLNSPELNAKISHPLNIATGGVDVPALVAKVNGVLDQFNQLGSNLAYLTRQHGEANAALANVQHITQAMTGKYGISQGLLGGEQQAQLLIDTLQHTRDLTQNLNQLSVKVDHLAFDKGGLADKADASLTQISTMLTDIRSSLKKVDELLVNANGLTSNLKQGTDDMGQLRSEVDEALSKTNQLITKLNRYLPTGKPGEVKLP
jgi:phospholipid/cholesterol/gamma-HCH transport system substrate-binding protein